MALLSAGLHCLVPLNYESESNMLVGAIIVSGVLAVAGFIGMGSDNRKKFFEHGVKFGDKK